MNYTKWLIILLASANVKADNDTSSTLGANETGKNSDLIFNKSTDNQTSHNLTTDANATKQWKISLNVSFVEDSENETNLNFTGNEKTAVPLSSFQQLLEIDGLFANSTIQDNGKNFLSRVVREYSRNLIITNDDPWLVLPCWIDSTPEHCRDNRPTYQRCFCPFNSNCEKCYDRCDYETPGFSKPQCLRDDYCGNWYGKEFGCEDMPGVSCLQNINRCRNPVPIYDNNWWVCPCESNCTKCYDRCDGRTSGFLAYGQCLRDDYCGDWYGKNFDCENLPGTTCITAISRCVYQNGTHHPHLGAVYKDYCGSWFGVQFGCENIPDTHCQENINRCVLNSCWPNCNVVD